MVSLEEDLEEDQRVQELKSVEVIYPEFVSTGPFSGRIGIEINPAEPAAVRYTLTDVTEEEAAENPPEFKLAHLPPLEVKFSLPDGYPENKAPEVELSSMWIEAEALDRLKNQLYQLWDSLRAESVFNYIDTLITAADELFEIPQPICLLAPARVKLEMLDFNSKTRLRKFHETTFNCDMCMEPKKGSVCFKLYYCGHVFCTACLKDYYTNLIEEGDIAQVHCPDYTCGEDAREVVVGDDGVARKMPRKAGVITSSELDDIIEKPILERYMRLLRKRMYEQNKDQMYCPRSFCGGPASRDGKDQLCVCMDCGLAFCADCGKTWHGYNISCKITHREKSKEEIESEKWLEDQSTKCPTCLVPIIKSTGCNHMICSKCQTHFCLLCGSFLWAANPYSHYNQSWSHCYQRLWEGVDTDAPPDLA